MLLRKILQKFSRRTIPIISLLSSATAAVLPAAPAEAAADPVKFEASPDATAADVIKAADVEAAIVASAAFAMRSSFSFCRFSFCKYVNKHVNKQLLIVYMYNICFRERKKIPRNLPFSFLHEHPNKYN